MTIQEQLGVPTDIWRLINDYAKQMEVVETWTILRTHYGILTAVGPFHDSYIEVSDRTKLFFKYFRRSSIEATLTYKQTLSLAKDFVFPFLESLRPTTSHKDTLCDPPLLSIPSEVQREVSYLAWENMYWDVWMVKYGPTEAEKEEQKQRDIRNLQWLNDFM
jgi:hypothetical protein